MAVEMRRFTIIWNDSHKRINNSIFSFFSCFFFTFPLCSDIPSPSTFISFFSFVYYILLRLRSRFSIHPPFLYSLFLLVFPFPLSRSYFFPTLPPASINFHLILLISLFLFYLSLYPLPPSPPLLFRLSNQDAFPTVNQTARPMLFRRIWRIFSEA